MSTKMSSERRIRKDKEIVLELESQVKDIRTQLAEQNRCLDIRLEAHMGMLSELQDFYRRRAEVEMEYSRQLDKLVKHIAIRHKQEKPRREHWCNYSTHACWQSLLSATRRQSRDHATISDVYTQHMTSRFQDIMDDMQRIHRKCKDIGAENHEELIKVLNELQSAMKTYHQYHGESIQAENKLKYVETQKLKAEQGSKAGTLSKKARNMEKQADKKQKKYLESKHKALVARNEYLLSLDTANAAVQRYYCDDLHNLINCIDCGYHNGVERSLMMHLSGDENLVRSRQESVKNMRACVDNLDQGADKQRFLELYNTAFALPKRFEFQPHKGDEVRQISAQKVVQADLLERLHTLDQNIKSNKLETDEIWKTIETVEKSFIELINQKDYDVTPMFHEEQRPPKSPHEKYKKRSDRMDTEEFYIKKFRDFTIQSNRIARLQIKYNSLQKALGEGGQAGSLPRPPSLPPKPKNSRRLGKIPKEGGPKLFGGSIEEYVEATDQEIPPVVRSCVRVINLYGRYHQGVFRVSGAQHEINSFKNSFEKGDDPLTDIMCAKDINSVASLLKLYFRELKEPLFPTHLFDELINCSKLNKPDEAMLRVRDMMSNLPKPTFVVARYLFAFLSHLSEYSDENMMDAYNLAICFGPTVLPIPPDRDQVQYQNYVIDLVKHIILQHEVIFPKEIEGALYEKIVIEEEDGEGHDNVDNLSDEDIEEIADNASEEDIFDEPEPLEAVAQYDFHGRSQRELSFRKGDVLEVYEQVSQDWWRGASRGMRGLIPAKYISVRSLSEREEERLHASQHSVTRDNSARDVTRDHSPRAGSVESHIKRKSAESLPARPYPEGGGSESGGSDISASQPNVSSATLPLASRSATGLMQVEGLLQAASVEAAAKAAQQQKQHQEAIAKRQFSHPGGVDHQVPSPTQENLPSFSHENLKVSTSTDSGGSYASNYRRDRSPQWHHVNSPRRHDTSSQKSRGGGDHDPDNKVKVASKSRDTSLESPIGHGERSHTPVAPSPLHSAPQSPAPRTSPDAVLETDLDFDDENVQLKDPTLTASHTEFQEDNAERLLSDLNSLSHKESMSRETILSKDSGFSQTSSSRETTPGGDEISMHKSGSQELLEEEEQGEEKGDVRGGGEQWANAPPDPLAHEASSSQDDTTGDSNGVSMDWHRDIDDALAVIKHGVESLEKQHHDRDLETQQHHPHPHQPPQHSDSSSTGSSNDTPDLVIGLPVGQTTPSPAASPKGKKPADQSPPQPHKHAMSTAEMFANNNQSTIKKGSHVTKNQHGGGRGERHHQGHHEGHGQGHPHHTGLETSASAGSVPLAFRTPLADENVQLMRRAASTTAALRSRTRHHHHGNTTPTTHVRHNSDPDDVIKGEGRRRHGEKPESPVSVQQQRTVHVVKPPTPPVRGFTPPRGLGGEHHHSGEGAPVTPPLMHPIKQGHDHGTPRGPKPPIKMKPPVMKKPVKSPEVLKRLKEAQENNAQMAATPP